MVSKAVLVSLLVVSIFINSPAYPQAAKSKISKARNSKAPVVEALRAEPRAITSQYDNARTGANLNETTLTPENVNSERFGKLFSLKVDGDVYAQPLYLPRVPIPGMGTHNVVYVATEHDSVYAFDSGASPPTPLWQKSFLNEKAGIKTVPWKDTHCPMIVPEVGITSTPVIDPDTRTMYVLARTKESREGFFSSDEYVQRLHALDVTTGEEKFGESVIIRTSGHGAGSFWGKLEFNPLRDNARASLLLANGIVYLTFASSCDQGPFHGWVIAYDARTLRQAGVFSASPDSVGAGMWLGDTGPAADQEGNVFVATGNGLFDADRGGLNFGDSILKLALTGGSLSLRDWFTPFNQQALRRSDLDLGSGGPVLLPVQPGNHPHLLVLGGKGGTIYLLDRDRMGKYHPGDDTHAVQTVKVGRPIMSAPAFWNGHLYYANNESNLVDFAVQNGLLSTQPVARSRDKYPIPGATPTISAEGNRNGIVWLIESRYWQSRDNPAILHAYDAANVARKLYDSEQNSARDRAGKTLRFNIPLVVNGRVYVGGNKQVDIYGLLPSRK